jgi:hypothetical protein
MKIAKRQATATRESQLNSLEAFANLGETPEDWKRFRLKYPHFFPENLTEWFYNYAEDWALRYEPGLKEILKPPLLYYRNRLRRVWGRNDRHGANLKLLLGFEKEVNHSDVEEGQLLMSGWPYRPKGKRKLTLGILIPGQSLDDDAKTTVAGLPPGRPIVNGATGAIDWKFGCALQQAVYELMQQRWRAMVCAECSKFFLADKTRQVFCSPACCGEARRKRALDYWNRKGKAERDKRTAKGSRF